MVATWLVVCVTHSLGLAIIFVGCRDCPEFRFGLHADSIVPVDFIHILGSIEGRFVSSV